MNFAGKLLTVNEVLQIAEVSRYTLYRDSKKGIIKPIHFGKSVRYREDEVVEYAKKKSGSNKVKYYKKKEES